MSIIFIADFYSIQTEYKRRINLNNPLKKDKTIKKQKAPVYINSQNRCSLIELKNELKELLSEYDLNKRKIIILCIGTDRATGDCLGPIVGHKLNRLPMIKNTVVFGSLESPVHAQNLAQTVFNIKLSFPDCFIIAIDACLGLAEHISCICVGEGTVKPGAGVKKDLPEVGDIFITGIVNSSFVLNMSVLQSTRLNTVVKMAEVIASGLWLCLKDLQ